MVYAVDSKPTAARLEGSSPSPGTNSSEVRNSAGGAQRLRVVRRGLNAGAMFWSTDQNREAARELDE